METRYATATFGGPCESCGEKSEASIPTQLISQNLSRDALSSWPERRIEELFCKCGRRPFPLGPVPVILWESTHAIFILDSRRKASDVLRMIWSWVVTDARWQKIKEKKIVVFESMEKFAFVLQRNPRLLLIDVHAYLAPSDIFGETGALIDFADGALECQSAGLAYSVLSSAVRLCPLKLVDRKLREAIEIVAHASADELVFAAGQTTRALDDFERLYSEARYELPYLSLLDIPIWLARFDSGDSEGISDGGRPRGVIDHPPDEQLSAMICSRILVGVCVLLEKHLILPDGVGWAESKSTMCLNSVWPGLDARFREGLLRECDLVTNDVFRRRYFDSQNGKFRVF